MTVSGESEKTANHRKRIFFGACRGLRMVKLPYVFRQLHGTPCKVWQMLLLCAFTAGAVSACSEAQDTDSGLPSDPVAHELMQRKAEEASRAFVSVAEVSAADPQRTLAANGATVVTSLSGEDMPSGGGTAGLPDSFRLLTRHAADASARAAHAAADAMGVPDVPQSRLQPRAAAQVADDGVAVEAELPVTEAPQPKTDDGTAGESQASGAESAVKKNVADSRSAASVGAADAAEVVRTDDAAVLADAGVTPVAAVAAQSELVAADSASGETGSTATPQKAASTARSAD